MGCFGFYHLTRSVPGFWHSCRVCLVPSGFWQGLVQPGRLCPGAGPSRTGTQQDLPLDAMDPPAESLGYVLPSSQIWSSESKSHAGKICSSAVIACVAALFCSKAPAFSGTLSIQSLTAFKFTAGQNKCVNSMDFVYLILLYNTLNLIPCKRNNLAKTSLNSLIRTGWLILFEQMDYFAIRSTNVNQLYF